MFNLGGLATLLHILALAHVIIMPVSATPVEPLQTVSLTARAAAAIYQRSLVSRSNETLIARADCSKAPTYNAPPITNQKFAPFNEAEALIYRYRRQQSVNLGSWFMHESWMTHAPYECAAGSKGAEIDIAHGWGGVAGARAVLEKHWDTFIIEDDFKYLAGIGINTVRLPIGYFNLGPDFTKGTPFEQVGEVYKNCWPRILRTINQAEKYGIGVLVDLHGAVGSQNGNDHSGVSDHKTQLFSNPSYMDKTIDVLTFMTKELVNVTNVVGIQILNEPHNDNGLIPFYKRAIDAMRDVSAAAKQFPLYIHDAFDLGKFSNFVAELAPDVFLVQDHHSYFVFGDAASKTAGQHLAEVQGGIKSSLQNAFNKQHRNLVVDEWSCAIEKTDDDTTSAKFCHAQLDTYQQTTAGWSFWAYLKDDCDKDHAWCFKSAVGTTLPGDFFSYSGSHGKVPESIAASATITIGDHPPPPSNTTSTLPPNKAADEHNDSHSSSPSHTSTPTSTSTSTCNLNSHKARSLKKIHKRSKHARIAHEKRDAAQAAKDRGYADGVQAAKNFASFNMSKLGFIQQYVHDNLAKLSQGTVDPSNESQYVDSFLKGLHDGEAQVQDAV